MKALLCISLLLMAFSSKAQTGSTELEMDSIEVVFAKLPDFTDLGKPDGQLISMEIGPSGGKIRSDDGKIELIFPEGALTKTTNISVQPVNISIPNTSGKGYRFEPSGIQFAKPVQLIFHYSNEEAESCAPELMFMALQDHNGKWEYFQYTGWDSTKMLLTGSISHFSTMVNGREWELTPRPETIKVGKSLELYLNIAVPPGEDGLSTLPPLPPGNAFKGYQLKWSVEGGSRFGTIARGAWKSNAIYTAPPFLPGHNAKITLKIDTTIIRVVRQQTRHRSRKWVGETRIPMTRNIITLSCEMKIYDEYRIVAITRWTPLSCLTHWIDSSSFMARLFSNRVEIRDVKNRPPEIHERPKCPIITYTTEGCLGPVHINSELVTNYTNDGNDPPKIEFRFQPVEVIYIRGYGTVNGFRGPTIDYKGETQISKVNFIANRKAQTIDLPGGPAISSLKVEPF